MATTDPSGDPHRDYGSPATWGDVERVRLSLEAQIATVETQMARMETRLTRWIVGVMAAGVGVLVAVLEALR